MTHLFFLLLRSLQEAEKKIQSLASEMEEQQQRAAATSSSSSSTRKVSGSSSEYSDIWQNNQQLTLQVSPREML